GAAKNGAFRLAEAFALPSHQENFGIAVAEALAYKVPVLLTPKVNIFQIIEDSGAAIVNSDDLEGTEKSLKEWKELSIEQRTAMGEKARACFDINFEVHASAQNLVDIVLESQNQVKPDPPKATLQ